MARNDFLDRLLDPLGRTLTPEVAKRIVELRADEETQRHINEMADRNTEGQLSADEHSEYEALVAAANVIAILQTKAHAVLRGNSAA